MAATLPPALSALAATAALDFHKPLDVVRAQFFDVDHAIRSKIHHDVSLRWLPPEAPGERRVEQEVKVMMRSHRDVFLIEDDVGGAWVKRFVDGPNSGTRFVAKFLSTAPGTTAVRIQAFLGGASYFGALGKLSQLGLQKALEKLLDEHRRALEGYEPGRARGAVAAVVGSLREAVLGAPGSAGGQARAVTTNLLEAACVVAVADGNPDDAEREVIQQVASTLCAMELDRAGVDRIVQNVARAVEQEGIEARCDKIAARLGALGLGDVGLRVAAVVASVSHGIDAPELAALSRLATALGVTDARLTELLYSVDQALSGQR